MSARCVLPLFVAFITNRVFFFSLFRQDEGHTALHWAACTGRAECVAALIEAGADVDVRDFVRSRSPVPASGLRPPGHAAGTLSSLSCALSHPSTSHSPPTPLTPAFPLPQTGRTALAVAVVRGNDQCVELLLAAGAGVDVGDQDGRTPLLFAAMQCRSACALRLIRAGADVKAMERKVIFSANTLTACFC